MTATERRRIGRYTIDQVIGTGAFAAVYRATDERLDATVAVKLLADNHCLDPDIRARFVDEGRALRRIDSPHVLRVYDVGETEQLQPYLVMEYADRGTLSQRVAGLRASGWRPGPDDLRVLVTDLAAAVEAVHAAQLVHRDLSPGNLLLRSTHEPATARPPTPLVPPGERLVVADLGLAKDLARSSGLTVAGGTDGFRPPEQRGTPAKVDARADLWALSAVLSWLLTGEAPDTADGSARQSDRHLAQAIADLSLPPALRPALRTSLADDPSRRHPDVATWRAAVLHSLTPPPAPPRTKRPTKDQPTPPAAAPRSADSAGAGPGGGLPPHQATGPSSDATRGRRVVVAVALVLAGGVMGATVAGPLLSGDDAGGGGVSRRQLENGRVEVVDRDTTGDARLAVVGPGEADVGETVTFEARAEGVDEWAWLMPDGTVYASEPTVQLRTRSAGTAEITLVGMASTGERLEVVHELRLVDG